MTNDGQRSDPLPFQIENEMDLLLGRAPNPTREGCPPRDLLVSLSRRELPIDDPAHEHLSKCSPCYQEFRALQQADAAKLVAVAKRRNTMIAAAAVVAVAIGGPGSRSGRRATLIAQHRRRPKQRLSQHNWICAHLR